MHASKVPGSGNFEMEGKIEHALWNRFSGGKRHNQWRKGDMEADLTSVLLRPIAVLESVLPQGRSAQLP